MSFALSWLVFAAIPLAYFFGHDRGWEDAQKAWREQRAPLPSPSAENGE